MRAAERYLLSDGLHPSLLVEVGALGLMIFVSSSFAMS